MWILGSLRSKSGVSSFSGSVPYWEQKFLEGQQLTLNLLQAYLLIRISVIVESLGHCSSEHTSSWDILVPNGRHSQTSPVPDLTSCDWQVTWKCINKTMDDKNLDSTSVTRWHFRPIAQNSPLCCNLWTYFFQGILKWLGSWLFFVLAL